MNTNFLARLGEFFRSNKEAFEAGEVTPEEVQEAFRKARASAGGKQKAANKVSMTEEFGKGGNWKLFMEQGEAFAEPPASIHVLPKPGTYSHPRYGKFQMTPEIIASFVENHNNHVYQEQIPIDAEHETKLSGAVGYFGEMRLIDGGKGGAEVSVEWTDRGRQLIASDRFKYFSPEWFDEWSDPVGGKKVANVLVGGAITTRPFFKDKVLRPLVAGPETYQAGEWTDDEEVSERTLMFSEMKFSEEFGEKPAFLKDDEDDDEEEKKKKANLDPSDVHVNSPMKEKKAGGEPVEDKPEDKPKASTAGGKQMTEGTIDDATKAFVEAETKQLTEKLETETGLRQAAEERLAKLESDARVRRFNDIIMGRDAEGDGSPPFAGEHTAHVPVLTVMAEKFGEDSEEFKGYIAQQRAVSKQMREAGLFKEVGAGSGPDAAGGTTAARRFDDAVKAYMEAHPDSDKAAAIMAVSKAQPKLYTDRIAEENKKAKAASGTSYGYEDDDEGGN